VRLRRSVKMMMRKRRKVTLNSNKSTMKPERRKSRKTERDLRKLEGREKWLRKKERNKSKRNKSN
jgi:hypothetical protein